jgi:hypothetical protein
MIPDDPQLHVHNPMVATSTQLVLQLMLPWCLAMPLLSCWLFMSQLRPCAVVLAPCLCCAGVGGSLQSALEQSLATSLAGPLHEALRSNFDASLIPAFERATRVSATHLRRGLHLTVCCLHNPVGGVCAQLCVAVPAWAVTNPNTLQQVLGRTASAASPL